MSKKIPSLTDALMPECPRCKEPTPREAGASGYEPERRPSRVTKTGKFIPGKTVAVHKRQWRCLRCEKVYVVPEAEPKEKVKRARRKTTSRKRTGRAVANAK